MNAHPRDEELIDHAFGLLEGDTAARLDRHVADCAECRVRQAGLRERLGQLSLLQGAVEAPEPLITDTLRRIRLAGPAPASSWSRWLILGGAAAAAALALIGFPMLARHGAHPLEPTPADTSTPSVGVEVALVPSPRVLDQLDPLPAEVPAMPEALPVDADIAGAPELPAALAVHDGTDHALPRPATSPTGTLLALSRVDARALAKKDAAVLGSDATTRPAVVAAAKSAGAGRGLILPAAGNASPGPAVLPYRVAAADFTGRLGPENEVTVEQRGAQLTLANQAARSVTVRLTTRDGQTSDVRLGPGSRTNLALNAVRRAE